MVDAPNSELTETDTFVVHMTREQGALPKVTSIELFGAEMRNRYSFTDPKALGEVFAPDLSRELEQTLASFEDAERVISLPDFQVDLPGLLLSGLRVFLTRIEGEVEVIMMRFRRYFGNIKAAFKFDPSFAITSASVREKIAVEVLRDILTPLVDMINLNRPEYQAVIENHAPVLQKRLDQIATKQEELSFYSGLLQRYVAGCRQDSAREIDSVAN